jgi:tripartite-type tricarboxylate transporter receptor subunit TctC
MVGRNNEINMILCVLLSVLSVCAVADVYRARPIRLVVSADPGGGTDFVTRVIAPELSRMLEQSIVIENRGGSAGVVAGRLVADSAPDGYTMLMMSNNFATFPTLYKNLGYHPLDSFAFISQLAVVPHVLVVHPAVPAKSLRELIAYAKDSRNKLNYGSGGVGTMGHLATEQFKGMAGVEMQHIAYKGGGPSIIALLSGEIQLVFANLPTALAQVKAGRLRAIAVSSLKRSQIASEIPTMAESGLPGFESSAWFGLVAPKGTRPEFLSKVYRSSFAILQNGEIVRRLAAEGGMEPIGNKPEEYRQQLRAEIHKWTEVIRIANITAQ